MTIEQLLATKIQLNYNATSSSQALTDWCSDKRGDMGLLKDEYKQTETYKTLSAQYAYDREVLRQFNKSVSKNKEFQKANRERVMAMRTQA